MKKPSLAAAVQWIAENDAPGDNDPAESIAEYISTLLVADLFDVHPMEIAKRVIRIRSPEGPRN